MGKPLYKARPERWPQLSLGTLLLGLSVPPLFVAGFWCRATAFDYAMQSYRPYPYTWSVSPNTIDTLNDRGAILLSAGAAMLFLAALSFIRDKRDTSRPMHFWPRFSLRAFFALVTLLCVLLGWVCVQLKWIHDRHEAIGLYGGSGHLWPSPTKAPWSIRLFGETPNDRLGPIDYDTPIAEQERLHRLFPEGVIDLFTDRAIEPSLGLQPAKRESAAAPQPGPATADRFQNSSD